MIAHKGREVKRGRNAKMARNIERLYKEGKCRECSVLVSRMDFAKILGKFTKVKIQYENVSSPKTKKTNEELTPVDKSRLKTNENGMVAMRRNAYNKHPVNNSLTKKSKDVSSTSTGKKPSQTGGSNSRQINNVLKENNRLKKTPLKKDKNSNYDTKSVNAAFNKQYTIIFYDPKSNKNGKDCINKIVLAELLPKIERSILPSEEWCINYLPIIDEPKEDKVYDRIAAELEDLMYNEKPEEKIQEVKPDDNKVDEFPSIMDILNDNYTESEPKHPDQSVIMEFKSDLESSDVEAMLLGKTNEVDKPSALPMDVDNTDVTKLIQDVEQITEPTTDGCIEECPELENNQMPVSDKPHSPSILDENLQKGVEEHIPATISPVVLSEISSESTKDVDSEKNITMEVNSNSNEVSSPVSSNPKVNELHVTNPEIITHVIFKKVLDGECIKTVTCPKNLKYTIEFGGKSVELLGAPKYISSLDDLQVLLQIVNETESDSFICYTRDVHS